MKKFLISLALIFSASFLSFDLVAQNTSVTITNLIDSDSLAWKYATVTADISNPTGGPVTYASTGNPVTIHVTITTDATGSSFMSLASNTAIATPGTQWVFTIQPNASVPAQVFYPITITGGTQDITTLLTPQLIAPRFGCTISCRGYDPLEINQTATPGTIFYNSTTQACQQLSAVSTWGACASTSLPSGSAFQMLGYKTTGSTGQPFTLGPDLQNLNGSILESNGSHTLLYGLHTYGNSITSGVGCTVAANCYANLLNTNHNMGKFLNQGHSGGHATDSGYYILTNENPGDTGNPVTTLLDGTNEVLLGTSAANQLAFAQSLEMNISWMALSSTNKVLANNTTYVVQGGTWVADTSYSKANSLVASTSGATLTDATCTPGPSGVIYVYDSQYQASTGAWQFSVDGTLQNEDRTGTSTISAQIQGDPPTVQTFAPFMHRFNNNGAGFTNAAHNCVLTTTANGNVNIIGFGFPPTKSYRGNSGPTAFVGDLPPQNGNASASTVAIYSGILKSVVNTLRADGLYIKYGDTQNYVDSNLDMTGTATQNCPASTLVGLHPNDCGHMHIYQMFVDLIKPGFTIPLQTAMTGLGAAFTWNPNTNCKGSTVFCPGPSYYDDGINEASDTFLTLANAANATPGTPANYARVINAGGTGSIGSAFGYYTSAYPTTPAGLTINEIIKNGVHYVMPIVADATSGQNVGSSTYIFRGRAWNGASAGNEDFTVQTLAGTNGATGQYWFLIKNTTNQTTGVKGVWFQNVNSHGIKIAVDAAPNFDTMIIPHPSNGFNNTLSLPSVAAAGTTYFGLGLDTPNGAPTFTPGTNVTSVVCAATYTCTNSSGRVTIVGGTATTGTIATINFSATLAAAPRTCPLQETGSVTLHGLDHGLPTTTAFTVTAASTVSGATMNLEYECQP